MLFRGKNRTEEDRRKPYGFLDVFSQSLLFCQDKVAGRGEDSYLLSVNEKAGLFAVLDGCGGIGSRRYEEYGGKTGAYVASRAASEALAWWFSDWCSGRIGTSDPAAEMKQVLDLRMAACKNSILSKSALKGGMKKDFPTTLAACLLRADPETGAVLTDVIWSGDSRVYVLDRAGLHQLTRDDLRGMDAMQNISKDGVLTNVISASHPYEIHRFSTDAVQQGLIFAASDGCFEYVPSPMHFEYLMLDALMSAESLADWEKGIHGVLLQTAGDDTTLCGALLRFREFPQVREYYRGRWQYMREHYIEPMRQAGDEERQRFWEEYRTEYEQMPEMTT